MLFNNTMQPIIKITLITLLICGNIAALVIGIILNIRGVLIGSVICMIAMLIILYMLVFHKSTSYPPLRASHTTNNPILDV